MTANRQSGDDALATLQSAAIATKVSSSEIAVAAASACREAYLKNTLTKIAEDHPINKIDQLMPWQMGPPAADQPAQQTACPPVHTGKPGIIAHPARGRPDAYARWRRRRLRPRERATQLVAFRP